MVRFYFDNPELMNANYFEKSIFAIIGIAFIWMGITIIVSLFWQGNQ